MNIWTRRDLTIISGFGGRCAVIACDSCGGVGEKSNDCLKLPAYYVGKLTARVVLYELMCAGSEPAVLSDGLACEMSPTGEEIVRGIKGELKNAGLEDITLTGSTEENFPVSVTAVGITAVGIAEEGRLRFHKAVSGDKLVLLGRPAVGGEVELDSAGFYPQVRFLLSQPGVREISPVGSKGVAYEAGVLASLNRMAFTPCQTDVDLKKSAGPVSCVLALCDGTAADHIISCLKQAIIIGCVR